MLQCRFDTSLFQIPRTTSASESWRCDLYTSVLTLSNRYPDVKWTTPLSKLLPGDFVLDREYETGHITLEDALSHRSGLPRHDLAYGWNNASVLNIIRTMRYLPLTAEPRTKFQYCNLMIASVGAGIERVLGSSLETVFRELFWQPLGMLSTTFSLKHALSLKDENGVGRLARGYHWQGEYYIPEALMDLEPVAAAGATISSVNDYALWVKALLEPGRNESSPITLPLYKDMMTPRSILDTGGPTKVAFEAPRYSLGWFILMIDGKPLVTHPGTTIGFGSQVFILPEERFGFVTLANADGPGNLVGNLLFLQLLKRRFEGVKGQLAEQTLTSLREHSLLHTPTALTSTNSAGPSQQALLTRIPLPGKVEDYTGLYSHPGYGIYNISRRASSEMRRASTVTIRGNQQVRLSPPDANDQSVDLHVEPSSRMWPSTYILRHRFLTFFDADLYLEHGMPEGTPDCENDTDAYGGSRECRNETALQYAGRTEARFEYDSDGKVHWLGMQPDTGIAEVSRDLGGDGMIWFEKM